MMFIRHLNCVKWVALLVLVLIVFDVQNPSPRQDAPTEVSMVEHCFKYASIKHGVSERYLRAIGWVESKFKPDSISKNANGSIDVGVMQINSIHFPMLEKEGITKDYLMNPCVNIDVGARIYASKINRHGDTWRAVGAYNSERIEKHDIYLKRVKKALAEMPEFDV
jgi:soluble lytic murein transglycosylase-like protein